MKIYVSHYKKSGKQLFCNGGTLYIKSSKIILKNLFITVVAFDADKVKIKALPGELLYKSIEFTDGIKSYIFLFDKVNYRKLSECLNLQLSS